MKKFILILMVLSYALTVNAQQRTVIEGSIEGANVEKVIINQWSHPPDQELLFVAETKTDSLGNFKTAFPFSESKMALFYYQGLHHDIFIEPGDSLHLYFNVKQDSFAFSGNGAEANNFYFAFNKKFQSDAFYTAVNLREKNDVPKQCIQFIDSISNEENKFYLSFKSEALAKTKFNNYILSGIHYYPCLTKLFYAVLYDRLKGNSIADLIPDTSYYSFLKGVNIDDTSALTNDDYLTFLYLYSGYLTKVDRQKNGWNDAQLKGLFWQKDYIIAKKTFTGIIRDKVLFRILDNALKAADIDSVAGLVDDYKTVCLNADFYNYLEVRTILRKNSKDSKIAYNFSLPDANGDTVSLNRFKGKVVYIDFSAPWCSPCRREIPYADSLVDEFKDKEVQFVFISVYNAKDSAYDNSIKQGRKSIHLFANKEFDDPAVLGYDVKAIPRFVLVDRNGMIADADAKRPSNGAKKEIEQLLSTSP